MTESVLSRLASKPCTVCYIRKVGLDVYMCKPCKDSFRRASLRSGRDYVTWAAHRAADQVEKHYQKVVRELSEAVAARDAVIEGMRRDIDRLTERQRDVVGQVLQVRSELSSACESAMEVLRSAAISSRKSSAE